ncbi:MAG: leucine-rich repeat protein [Hominimerdicola sp.]
MYKKIAAGALALVLTLGSSALPAEMFENININAAITASAEQTEGDFSYTILNNGTAEISEYTGSDTEVTVPSTIGGKTVTSIGKSAFQNKKNITSVTLPSSITSIGEQAFLYCTVLESINIPSSVTSIGAKAFSHCTLLKSVTIPSKVTVINNDVFNWCEGLESVTLPSGITTIGDGAFTSCTSLTSLEMPSSVTYIGNRAFTYCRNLTELNIPSGVTFVGKDAFDDNVWYENLSDGLFYAGKVAYAYIGTMAENTSISIKSGTTCIADEAFKNCSLSSVTIPNSVTSIGSQAFYKTSLTSVTIPNSVTSIGSEAFTSCSNLTKVSIPSSVQSIGTMAFSWTGITSAVIPEGVTAIASSTFANCQSLTSVSIPDSVTSIGNSAFDGCTSLAEIVIPSTVNSIGNAAFRKTAISSVVIPSGVEKIDFNTFYNCTNLTSVSIPNTVTSIGYSAFYNCPALKELTVPSSVTTIGKDAIGYYYDSSAKTTVPGFVLKGASGSAAETYAANNGLTFTVAGSTTKTNLSTCTVTLSGTSFEYTGSAIKPAVTVKNGSKTLTSGTDYTVSYTNNVNAGTATVTITGTGNYTGTVTKTFTITKTEESDTKDISKCTITLSGTSFSYTGSAIKPKVTITDGTRGLVLNTDYAVRYIDNIEVGTASIKIAGKGDYTGTVYKTFTITESTTTPITNCTISLSKDRYVYSGKACKPKVTITNGSTTLTSGTDYVIRYVNNVNPGTATIVIAGRGKYTGSTTATFTIASDFTKCDITLSKTTFTYTGNACKPKVTVKDGDKTLVLNTDYAIRYVNNVNVGTASVVISGKNDYAGSVTKTFTIK